MPDYRKLVRRLIIWGLLIRCLLAFFIELGNDEVYYWTYSQHLQWNYFDHPPMVALLIRLTTINLHLQQYELFVRLGSIISCAFATFFIFRTGSVIHSEKTGFISALLYNTSLYSSIISGVFILPDSPQMLFWTASLYLLAKLHRHGTGQFYMWIGFGIISGLAIMSKVHGIFIWSGLLLYILIYRRKWFSSYPFYISGIICLIIIIPIFAWNIQNDFITYRFHSQRAEGSLLHFRSDNFFREIFGEVFYNNPVNFFFIMIALISFFKKKQGKANPFLRTSVLIALPMILILIFLSMFNDTLPHWSGPAYVTLIPLAAKYISEKTKLVPGKIPVLKWSVGFILFIIIAGAATVNFYPGTLSSSKNSFKTGEGDVTLDMYGWREAAMHIDSLVKTDEINGIMSRQSQFVSNNWFPAAHIDYYIARPLNKYVIGLGNLNDLHNYAWLNASRLKNEPLHDAYCIVPSNYSMDIRNTYSNSFESIDSVCSFAISRGGRPCKYFFVYRLRNFTDRVPEIR
jgi:4-amino-4-deoxy-L-arabinose transferase-like glycosyltransferase